VHAHSGMSHGAASTMSRATAALKGFGIILFRDPHRFLLSGARAEENMMAREEHQPTIVEGEREATQGTGNAAGIRNPGTGAEPAIECAHSQHTSVGYQFGTGKRKLGLHVAIKIVHWRSPTGRTVGRYAFTSWTDAARNSPEYRAAWTLLRGCSKQPILLDCKCVGLASDGMGWEIFWTARSQNFSLRRRS
jgi:hypothetical protein